MLRLLTVFDENSKYNSSDNQLHCFIRQPLILWLDSHELSRILSGFSIFNRKKAKTDQLLLPASEYKKGN